MVSYKEIQAANALINDVTAPRVAVFVGGTLGIGQFTIKALVATGASVRIYLVGRKSSEERMHDFIQELNTINPKADVIWIEGEISLLAETKRICEIIKSKETRIDLLFLSAGYSPFRARKETAEGLAVAQSLEYYTRILFIIHLLPLLDRAESSKVVSVLGAGMESENVDLDDMDLEKPGNFGGIKGQLQYTTMNSVALEKLANDNHNVTFIHSWPGWVNTGSPRRSADPGTIKAWLFWLIIEPLYYAFATNEEEAGQRHLFQSTSAAFGGRGVPWQGKQGVNSLEKQADGVFLVNYKCDCTPNAKVMSKLRVKAQGKIWGHTEDVLRPYI
jgi:NAD(P)-dependent dehydrogenase (short-subunit alcohol dehydrogenase family)